MKLLIFIIMMIFISCSSGGNLNVPPERDRSVIKERKADNDKKGFSVVPYDIDDIKFPEEVKLAETSNNEKVKKTISGYRIQVESFKDFQMFRAFIKKLRAEIDNTDYEVYDNIFHSPYFKVRVGDFRSRDEAKQALPVFINLGYKGAYPVKDNIVVYE